MKFSEDERGISTSYSRARWNSSVSAVNKWTALIPLLAVAFLVIVPGCVSRPTIADVMIPYPALRSIVIGKLPQGLKKQSINGRELTSDYFSPADFREEASESTERAFAFVTILGAGRPYQIDIKVFRERKDRKTGRYVRLGNDKKLADRLAKQIKDALVDRREERNIIDEFRAF